MFSSEPGRLGHVVRHFSVVGMFFVTGRVAHFSHHNPFTRRSARHHAAFPMTTVRTGAAIIHAYLTRSAVWSARRGGHWSFGQPRQSLVSGQPRGGHWSALGGHWSLVRHAAVTGHWSAPAVTGQWSATRRSLVIWSAPAVTGQWSATRRSLVSPSAVIGQWSDTRRSLVIGQTRVGHWSAPRRSLVSPSVVIALVSSAAVIGQ